LILLSTENTNSGDAGGVTIQVTDSVTATEINTSAVFFGLGGDVAIDAGGDVSVTNGINTAGNVFDAGDVSITTNSSIITGDISTRVEDGYLDGYSAGDVNLTATSNGDITVGNIDTNAFDGMIVGMSATAGNVAIDSDTGDLIAGDISAVSDFDQSGSISLSGQNVTVGDINNDVPPVSADSSNVTVIIAAIENVVAGDILTRAFFDGGDVDIAGSNIKVGGILTSGSDFGGNVSIDGDTIELDYINTESTNGQGGDVDIIFTDFFRAISTLTDFNGVDASIPLLVLTLVARSVLCAILWLLA
jgi:hypothetical protein